MTLEIGTISHGTHRAADLASSIFPILKNCVGDENSKLLDDLLEIMTYSRDSDEDHETIQEAIETLQEYAPPFTYVGTHEGDGSDLGCWPDTEAMRTAIHDKEAVAISDLSDIDKLSFSDLSESRYAILTNDHGNVTVYELSVATTPLWACV